MAADAPLQLLVASVARADALQAISRGGVRGGCVSRTLVGAPRAHAAWRITLPRRMVMTPAVRMP